MRSTSEQGAGNVNELSVSNDALNDVGILRHRIAGDGYLFFRGLLEAEILRDLRRQILRVCQAGGWLRAGSTLADGVAEPARACTFPEPEYMAIYNDVLKLESFHRLAHAPLLLDLAAKLVAETPLVHAMNIARVVFPPVSAAGYDYATPPHQDFVPIQGSLETFTIWIPIEDCPRELGGLAILAGSNHGGVYDTHLVGGTGGMAIDTDELSGEWVTTDYRLGDLVVFHSLTVHKALPNRTVDRLRLSVDYRYSGVSQPIVAKEFLPHGQQISWDEIYAGWQSTDLQYYWRKFALDIVPFDTRYNDQRDIQAFELAGEGNEIARAALVTIVNRDPDPAKRGAAQAALRALDARAARRVLA